MEDNVKSQHKDANEDRMTTTERKTKKSMSKSEKPTEIREQKKKYWEIQGSRSKREISKENL